MSVDFLFVGAFCESSEQPVIKSPDICCFWHQGNLIKTQQNNRLLALGLPSEV